MGDHSYQFLSSPSLRKHTDTHVHIMKTTLAERRGDDLLFMGCLTMSDCPVGILNSKAVVPSESRKVILLGRSILKRRTFRV